MGDVPHGATERVVGQVLPGLLAQRGPHRRYGGLFLLGIGWVHFYIRRHIDPRGFSIRVAEVIVDIYGCPGAARFRALWRRAAGTYDGIAGMNLGAAVP